MMTRANDGPWHCLRQLQDSVGRDTVRRHKVQEAVEGLQTIIEQEAEEFHAEASLLKRREDHAALQRQASLFMEHNVERFETTLAALLAPASAPAVAVPLS